MEETFERIRGQINSKLDNQKQISITLLAIEETIKEQKSTLNATSYFAALLTTLEQQLAKNQQLQQPLTTTTTTTITTTTTTTTAAITTTTSAENIIGPILYLLNIVLKELPKNILKNKYSIVLTIFFKSFENLENINNNDSAIIRSLVGCLESLLSVQDINVWQQFQTKKIYQNLLLLSIDNRPKPRKKVHDSIKKILFTIISDDEDKDDDDIQVKNVQVKNVQVKNDQVKKLSGLSGNFKHPAIDMTIEFCTKILKEYIKTDQTSVLHILSLLKEIIGIWTTENLYSLCEILINIPKYNQKYLTVSSFQLFEILFQNNSKGFILGEEGEGEGGNEMNKGKQQKQQKQQHQKQQQLQLQLQHQVQQQRHRFKELLISLMDLMPNIKDVQLLPQWLMIIARGFPIYVECNKDESEIMLQEFFIKIFGILESDNSDIIIAATVCLCELVSSGITDDMIQKELNYNETNQGKRRQEGCLNIIILTLENSFTFKYQNAWPGIFEIIKELFKRFHKSSYPLLNNLLKIITDIRMDKSFEFKEEIDIVIGSAIENMGPKHLLNIIPLNLEISNNNNNGRAWLLPLLKDHIINSELGYFLKEFIPLSQRLQQKSLEFQQQNRLIESKIYETLYQQIWSLLPGFCNLPIDLEKNFNKSTGELLSKIMYQQPDLRPIISLSLQNLVEKNKELLNSDKDDQELKKLYNLDKNDAKNNLDLITKHSNNYLAVFFNVLSETLPSFKNYLLEVIKSFLSITSLKDVNNVYVKVINLLKQSLQSLQSSQSSQPSQPSQPSSEQPPPMSHTMLDLSILMTPYLNITSINQLYEIITNLISKDDSILQKKSYKILKSLTEIDNGKKVIMKNIEDLQIKLRDSTINTTSSSKKDRLLTLSNIIKLLPESDLHMIPDILSEVILSTKEVNEKSRLVAYDLLIIMGNKMKKGGIIIMSKILESNDTSSSNIINANIDEFVFNMVIAGLAATTPHMISATITSLSRLLFEFKNDLNKDYIHKLIDTMNNFVNCTNREIVKSALGFVKVLTISLDLDLINPHLNQIINGLLTWSNEHKSHFKVKVRHIFERLIRRFGYDTIEKFVPENDKKLLVNIKKRKERAKKKKIADQSKMNIDNDDDDDDDDNRTGSIEKFKGKRSIFNNAYEDALYGSESDLEDTDDDGDGDGEDEGDDGDGNVRRRNTNNTNNNKISKKNKGKKKDGKSVTSWIKEGDDDDDYTPVDFLDKGAISKVIGVNPSNTRKQRKDFSKAFKETRDGKMVINESDDESDDNSYENTSDIVMQEADDNYTESQKSNDGFTRGQGNKIKFKRRNKKNNDDYESDDNMDIDDIKPIDAIASRNQKKRKNKIKNKKAIPIGNEYKAKNAGGDIKRKGKPDPFAYVSLTSVYKGKRHNQQKGPKISITSKSKIHKRQGMKGSGIKKRK